MKNVILCALVLMLGTEVFADNKVKPSARKPASSDYTEFLFMDTERVSVEVVGNSTSIILNPAKVFVSFPDGSRGKWSPDTALVFTNENHDALAACAQMFIDLRNATQNKKNTSVQVRANKAESTAPTYYPISCSIQNAAG